MYQGWLGWGFGFQHPVPHAGNPKVTLILMNVTNKWMTISPVFHQHEVGFRVPVGFGMDVLVRFFVDHNAGKGSSSGRNLKRNSFLIRYTTIFPG